MRVRHSVADTTGEKRVPHRAWLLVVLAALLTACGGGNNAGTPDAPSTPASPPSPGNTAPTAADVRVETNADQPVSGRAAASDPDGDPLSFSAATRGAHGAVQVASDGRFTYTPDSGYTGDDSFDYTVSDGRGGADTASVLVHINHPPSAAGVCVGTPHGTARRITLRGSDPETPSNALAYSVGQPRHGRVDVTNTNEVTYTPDQDAPWGADSFTYTVTDADGASASARVDVVVRPRIMPLGDSITYGVYDQYDAAGGSPAGYRKPLWDALAKAGYQVDFVGGERAGPTGGSFDRDNEGHPGIRTQQYADGYTWNNNGTADSNGVREYINSWLDANPADIILLHIGTNDLNTRLQHSYDRPTTSEVYQGIQEILANIRNWAGAQPAGHVPVLLAQIIGGNQSDATDRNTFNGWVTDLNSRITDFASQDVKLVDQYSALAPGGTPDSSLYANSLHPDQAGYDAMARRWETRLETLLDNRGARCPPG